MRKTFCDYCGKLFDEIHQVRKYDIRDRTDPNPLTQRIDLCDECRKNIEEFIENFKNKSIRKEEI